MNSSMNHLKELLPSMIQFFLKLLIPNQFCLSTQDPVYSTEFVFDARLQDHKKRALCPSQPRPTYNSPLSPWLHSCLFSSGHKLNIYNNKSLLDGGVQTRGITCSNTWGNEKLSIISHRLGFDSGVLTSAMWRD